MCECVSRLFAHVALPHYSLPQLPCPAKSHALLENGHHRILLFAFWETDCVWFTPSYPYEGQNMLLLTSRCRTILCRSSRALPNRHNINFSAFCIRA